MGPTATVYTGLIKGGERVEWNYFFSQNLSFILWRMPAKVNGDPFTTHIIFVLNLNTYVGRTKCPPPLFFTVIFKFGFLKF
jgi:hypothetical protein